MAKRKSRRGRSRPEIGKAYAESKKSVAAKRSETNGEPVEHLKTYECHGVEFHRHDGDEHRAVCPFCEKDALSVNEKEGLFKCWDCGKQGNKYTFLQLFYDQCFDSTTPAQLKKLAKLRKLPVEVFELAEVAYDASTKRWLIPIRDQKSSMVNLRHWRSDVPNAFNMNTAGCKTHLYNLERLDPTSPHVFICEGEWDCMAMEWLLTSNKVKDTSVVAVPGADIFKEEWVNVFADKAVTLFYDNDDRGKEGMKKSADILRAHTRCRSLNQIKWPISFPEKFDVSDYIGKNKSKPKRTLTELRRMVAELPLHDRKSSGLVRETFDAVVKDFKENIYLSQDMKDALLLIFSVIFSNRIFPDPYCPLWLFLVAPPGGGKTMLLQSTGDTDVVAFVSTLTPKTLVSGFKTTDGSDLSLLPKIIGKTLIVKDWTGIMSLSSGEQEEIYGVFRDAYDGRVEKAFGHIGTRIYPEPGSGHDTCHFTVLAGVTGAVHADQRANKGERFLKYQMMAPSGRDAVKQIQAAITNTVESTNPETSLRESASSFIESKFYQKRPVAKVPQWVNDRIVGLGQIVSTVRAVVLRKQGELVVRPESEVASRISKQLIKLGQAVAFTLDKKEIDEECYRIMQRVGLDTCYGWHRDVIMTVASAGKKGILKEDVCRQAVVSGGTTQRCLEDLFELGALVYHNERELNPEAKRRPGQPAKRWFLTEFMSDLFERAKIDTLIRKKVSREIKDRKRAKEAIGKKKAKPSSPRRKVAVGKNR